LPNCKRWGDTFTHVATTKGLVEKFSNSLEMGNKSPVSSRRGRYGESNVAWQLVYAYAENLSPALHMDVNEVYGRFKSGDVTLACAA
jgi:hypothetical protein